MDLVIPFARPLLAGLLFLRFADAASSEPPPAVAKVLKLFADLNAAQQNPAAQRRVSFTLNEAELNQHFRHSLAVTPRPGIESIFVKIFPNNYISTFTMVDFDAVERWKPGTIPSLMKPVLSGKRTVWTDFRFQSDQGQAKFTVEKAYFEKIPIPAFVVNRVIEALGASQPEKYDTTAPLPLPLGLKKAWTEGNLLKGEN